ncbi:PilZ domain-containing protein [Myxococcota bacterium]|nr:PilZ domain-containing protein [Myxococcota bacterium]MCZ7618188.1 PilZ domain-containing protein [Myxococcota bacterium]
MGQQRSAKRVRRRMACELRAEGRLQSAIVLDVSQTGLFVQTSTRLAPGTVVEVQIRTGANDEPIQLRARVVRHKSVPANLTSVAHGGIGLRILEAPKTFYDALGEEAVPGGIGASQGAARTPERPAPTPTPARFRVRMKQIEGSRSRTLEVAAATADAARASALAQLGSGWEALDADAL